MQMLLLLRLLILILSMFLTVFVEVFTTYRAGIHIDCVQYSLYAIIYACMSLRGFMRLETTALLWLLNHIVTLCSGA